MGNYIIRALPVRDSAVASTRTTASSIHRSIAMDKLSGFDLDHIAEHPSSTASSNRSRNGAHQLGNSKPDLEPQHLDPNSSLTTRRQSHTGSTRPSVSQPQTNRVTSGSRNVLPTTMAKNSVLSGLVSPPLQRELSAGRAPHGSLFEALSSTSANAGVPRKQKPVGFKDKLKKEEAGTVRRRSGAVLARG